MAIGEQLKGDSNEAPKWRRAGAVLALSAAILSGCSSSSETPDAPTTAGQTAEQIGDNTDPTEEALTDQPKDTSNKTPDSLKYFEVNDSSIYTPDMLEEEINEINPSDAHVWRQVLRAIRDSNPRKAVVLLADAGYGKDTFVVAQLTERNHCDGLGGGFEKGVNACLSELVDLLLASDAVDALPNTSNRPNPDTDLFSYGSTVLNFNPGHTLITTLDEGMKLKIRQLEDAIDAYPADGDRYRSEIESINAGSHEARLAIKHYNSLP